MRAAAYWYCAICLAALAGDAQIRPAPPWIRQGGVVNEASRLPVELPGGALAPGAIISIEGLRFIPGETGVEVETPRHTWKAQVLEATADRIRARMPDLNEQGKATLYAVAKMGRSAGTEIHLTAAAAGIYTANHMGWGAASGSPATNGARVSIDATGLGHAGERSIEVLVAGRKAARLHRDSSNGIDRLSFDLPAGVRGCTIPVTVMVNGIVSNTATIDSLVECEAEYGRTEAGQRASVVLMRSDVILELQEGKQKTFTVDALRAGFDQWSVKGLQTLFAIKPVPGACVSWSGQISQEDLVLPGLVEQAVGGGEPDRGNPIIEGAQNLRDLDAGPAITVSGPLGSQEAKRSRQKPQVYAAVLGGNPPIARIPERPLFLTPGNYTIGIAGGADLAPAQIAVEVPASGQWTNRQPTSLVRRREGLPFEWSVPAGYGVLTVVSNIDRRAGLAGFTVCQAPADATQFRVPPHAMENLPLTGRGPSDLSLGFAGVIAIPLHPPQIQAPGKERLAVYFVSLIGRSVIIR